MRRCGRSQQLGLFPGAPVQLGTVAPPRLQQWAGEERLGLSASWSLEMREALGFQRPEMS